MNKKQVASQTTEISKAMVIKAPNLATAMFCIRGTAPYVQNKFSQKARDQMKHNMENPAEKKRGGKRDPKDFAACYEGALHVAKEGWYGIPAPAFRAGTISACRLVGFKMTLAKLSVFIEADGFDRDDGTPLVRITKGEPKYVEHCVRNDNGAADVRPRPMWSEGWEAELRVRFDADQFKAEDVANLLMRVGMQVGVGEGRPDSRNSAGMGWGTFELIQG